jgi:cell wall-associated NlpC family hydrolase
MLTEVEGRRAVVVEAKSWVGTPYVSNGLVKGRRGGTDCAMLLVGVYANVDLIPSDFDPRPYPPQWHIHRSEEKYANGMLQFASEVAGPPERRPLPGDLAMFKVGHVFAHGAIVIDWPFVVHAIGGSCVVLDDISKNTTGKRALWMVPKRFFSYWATSPQELQ